MLPAAHRLTDPNLFGSASRGRRSGSRTLVVHLRTAAHPGLPLVGLVVSKSVGNAVVRNRVKRRLRHLATGQVPRLPSGTVLVVRALPAAAGASYVVLGADLGRCVERALA